MKVALVIGHHPADQGSWTVDKKISEYKFYQSNLARLKDFLEQLGHEAVITNRSYAGGKTPSYAAMAANATNADLAIEFHFNSAGPTATGTESFYWYASEKGKLAAAHLNKAMVEVMGLDDRGIKPIKYEYERGFNFFKKTRMPAVMVEPAFAESNKLDNERLQSRINEMYRLMAHAIDDYSKTVA